MQMAERSARQALALDQKIGEAHAVLAQINSGRDNFLDAESGFFFAISLEPNEPTPHHWYSILLQKVGRLDAALEQARRAYELDPSAPVHATNLANVWLMRGDDEQALRYAALARDLGSGSGGSEGVEATVALRRGQWDDAKRLLLAQKEIPVEFRPQIGLFVDAVADPAKRPSVVATLRAVDPKVATQTNLLMPYIQLGQNDLVFQILNESLDRDRAVRFRDWDITHAWTVEARPIRKDPRFARITERIGLVDYWKQYGYPDHCHAGPGDLALVCAS
jgi:tetratricopeptide (TPR) repeat protein